MAEPKSLKVFRNSSARHFYLRRRPHQAASEANFLLAPGKTVQALDSAEETLLASMSDFRDVAEESPEIAAQTADLNAQLAAARAENAELKKKKAELEKQAKTVEKQTAARTSRK